VIISALAIVSALTAALLVGMTGSGHQSSKQRLQAGLLAKNAAAPGRMEHGTKNPLFPQGGEGAGGEGAQEAYENRAYPATRVAYAQVIGARNASKRIDAQTKASTKDPNNVWLSTGPTTLNVDLFGTQTYGVPTQWSGRVTSMASKCQPGSSGAPEQCTVYVGAAGGGVWRSQNALDNVPTWKNVSDGYFATTSIGSLTIDPKNPKRIYAGTGEPNGSSDSEAGVGLYRSDNSGDTWTLLSASVPVSKDRGIGAITVDPKNQQHLLMGTDVARHGASSHNGGRFTPPGAPTIGLYESTDGGASWNLVFSQPQDSVDPTTGNGGDFFRGGVTKIQFDPIKKGTYYFSMTGYGLYRGGAGFQQLFYDDESPNVAGGDEVRFEFAAVDSGKQDFNGVKMPCTRVYLGAGWNEGGPHEASKAYRAECANLASASSLVGSNDNSGWESLSSSNNTKPEYASFDFCQGQCSYDMFVVSPPGRPNEVFLGGSMQYGELPIYGGADKSNGRAVIRSTDRGLHWTDMTGDATKRGDFFDLPNAGFTIYESMHPDQHAMVFDNVNPNIWWEGSDGGVIRSNGEYKDNSQDCDNFIRGLSGQNLANCKAWLSGVPKKLTTVNAGLVTLQFESLSVDKKKPMQHVLGGTQDNGTLAYHGSQSWFLGITGDGGDSTINANDGNIVTHTYTNTFTDTNFDDSDPYTWDWTGDTMFFSGEASSFYSPMTADDIHPGTIFAGMEHVWRTQDNGGDQSFLDNHCNTTGVFGTSDELFTGNCGDWETTGTALNDSSYGSDKDPDSAGNYVAEITPAADADTMWAASRRGRVFVTLNRAEADPANVVYYRIDTAAQPTRFVSGIFVDPQNPYHAWITYAGYDAYATAAGTALGHIFEVTVNPGTCAGTTCTAVWVNKDYDIGDQPVTDIAYDQDTGDLYVSTDWGVYKNAFGTTTWVTAAPKLPPVAVYGLTLRDVPLNGKRVLYAATHGRGAWRLLLPDA